MAALMSHRASQVFSVEVSPALAAFGRANLERHGADNVTLEIGDASHGWQEHAPYDVIVLTGSTPILPRSVVEQLAPGGRLFAVVGEAPVMTARLVAVTAPGVWSSTDLFETVIAPLVNAEHAPRFRF
jgi:protein-L-isoaspartate(D-aspartate) O-methyltransferase